MKHFLLAIALIMGVTSLHAQQRLAKYKISWCGKDGKLKKSQIDSLMRVNCKKMVLEGAGKDAMITSYTCTMITKGQPPHKQADLPGGMFFPSINHYLQEMKIGDEVIFSDIEVRDASGMYIEKNEFKVTLIP